MKPSDQPVPQSNQQAQAKIWRALDAVRDEAEPHLTQRILLELLAAHAIHVNKSLGMEEALDTLAQELDINCVLLQPEHKYLRNVLCRLFDQLDPDTFYEYLGEAEEFARRNYAGRAEDGLFILPAWLSLPFSVVRLLLQGEPILCLDWGNTNLVPNLLRFLSISGVKPIALDQTVETTENVKLLTVLVAQNLELIRHSVRAYADWIPGQSSWRETIETVLGSGQFAAIIINLFAPAYNDPRYRTAMSQELPQFLSQKLAPNGQAILFGSAALLDGVASAKLRSGLQERLHVEAIVDLSSISVFPTTRINSALVFLRQPQQSITRRVTVFAPADPHTPLDEENPLGDLEDYLQAADQQLESEKLFERPTAELSDRWDPKFYSPARLQLQDTLINSAQATWLASVTQLLKRGTPPSVLKPFVKTKLAGVTHEDRQEIIAYLKSGDAVWLRREEDNPYDPNAIHVERRSGTSLGYLPAELAAEVAEPLSDLGGKYQAAVVKVQGGTAEAPYRGVTIQFAPLQYAKRGEGVTVVRPGDITGNRLTGPGEVAWLLAEDKDKVTRLKAGDILLYLRGFGKAGVVPRDFEGAVCHQDLAIVRPNEDIDPLYLLSFILSAEFQEQLQFVARGSALPRVDLASLEELLVIVPSLEVQRRIALVFAESQGELGPGFKDNIERWLDLRHGEEVIERQWIPSSLLSNLFSDWDRLHGFDDWLRLKHDYVRQLRNSIAHSRISFNEPAVDMAIMALGSFSYSLEQAWREKGRTVEVKSHLEQELNEFQTAGRRVENLFLRRRFLRLAELLRELLQAESAPLPIHLALEQNTLPVGIPALLRLAASNEAGEPLLDFEIRPHLSAGEFVDLPPWQVGQLDGGETYFFETRLRLDRPGAAELECLVRCTLENGSTIEQVIRLTLEAVPAEQIPFEPIQPNPYITGGAVDTPAMFFGRQDALDFLRTNLIGVHQSNVIVLQGNRRTGKSSILKQAINSNLFAPHIPVYIDCQGLGKLSDQRFFYKIGREIWKAMQRQGSLQLPPPLQRSQISEDDAFYDFREILEEWVTLNPGRRIILLIDEFELIDQAIRQGDLSPLVLENLRHLFQHRHELAAVLTGSYRLTRIRQDYWSILFGLGLKREVGFLEEPAGRQLITRPLDGMVTYAPEAVDRVIELTACQPYFIQMVCHNIVNVLNAHRTTYVTRSHVEEAAQETLVSADGHMRFLFDSADAPAWQAILVYIASSLAEIDALPLYQISQFVDNHHLSISRLELEQALREMADRDLIKMYGGPDQRRYGFKIDLVRQWIRRNYDLQSAISLAQSAPYVRED